MSRERRHKERPYVSIDPSVVLLLSYRTPSLTRFPSLFTSDDRMETVQSLLRTSPTPSNPQHLNCQHLNSTSSTPCSDPRKSARTTRRAGHPCHRFSKLQAAERVTSSFAPRRREAAIASMKPVDVGSTVQMQAKRSILTIETDRDVGYVSGGAKVYLGAFGAVGKMTAETVDYLLHVLEDRKQELLVNGGDKILCAACRDHVGTGAVDDMVKKNSAASEVARIQLSCSTGDDDDHVTGLVRSHSYEALVQLEGILEARHHRIMNDGLLESLPTDIT
uniref:Uncharacterized protein n=1 Tax=Hyaloperonospora arabidopsidis (strain Emoy2) TaxID=559515 RepID=M4BJD7_HYAAE